MCLILIAHRPEEPIPLLVLANRDEFYDRSSGAADYWQEFPEMIAGRDLVSGGAWFGVKNQRWATVTNIREGVRDKD
ncbi:MAG: NRDE family protein, partial [Desulfuromonadales bacterium]|nr:NRDE family protein [Desulfuromonadales bacterium]